MGVHSENSKQGSVGLRRLRVLAHQLYQAVGGKCQRSAARFQLAVVPASKQKAESH